MIIEGERKHTLGLESPRRFRVTVMHLFGEDEAEEKSLCGAETSADNRRSVNFYLEDRLHGAVVGIVCEGCKVSAPEFAIRLAQDLEAEGLADEAEDYRRLARTLMKEIGRNGADR